MNTYPEVSIVVTNYNNASFLDRCIRSLLRQNTSFDYEVIVVDDASSDDSISVLNHFKSEVTILENDQNLGLAASANRGILESRGTFVVRVDSDDFVSRHFVQTLALALAANKQIDAVSCDYVVFQESGNMRTETIFDSQRDPIACGILFRRDQLIEIGLYDDTFRFHEDKELRMRFDRRFTVVRIPIPLYRYCRHETNLSLDRELDAEYSKKIEAIRESNSGYESLEE